MLGFLELSLGEAAPSCALCGDSHTQTFRPVDDVLADLAEAISRDPASNVALTGLDASSCDYLEALTRAAREAGAVRLRADVDASHLAASAERLLDAGIRHVRFSLADCVVETSRVGLATAGVRTFADIASSRGAHVAVTATLRVCRHTVRAAPEMAVCSAVIGADAFLLIVCDPALDVRDAASWLAAACDTGMVNGIWTEVQGLPFCLMDGYELHLSNAVRAYVGRKSDACRSCAADSLCDGLFSEAASTALASLRVPPHHHQLAERLQRARQEVRT